MKLLPLILILITYMIFAETIAVIDSDRIFSDLGEVADAKELLETEIEEWEAHADSLQDDIDAIQTDLDYTMVMSPERRRSREALLEEKSIELQEFLEYIFGPGGLVESRNEELVSPIIANINEAVQEISKEEGYDIVFDTSAGVIIYVENTLDITDAVLEKLAVRSEN